MLSVVLGAAIFQYLFFVKFLLPFLHDFNCNFNEAKRKLA